MLNILEFIALTDIRYIIVSGDPHDDFFMAEQLYAQMLGLDE